MDLHEEFGLIDVYVFDQLLRGRLHAGLRVLDAGCGEGRNLVYALRGGFDVYGADQDEASIAHVRRLASGLNPALAGEIEQRFQAVALEALPWGAAQFDYILCNAVLHFARGHGHFAAMAAELGRVLRPGGIFFARLMSTVAMETLVRPLGDGRYRLPGGGEVFLADEALLLEATRKHFAGELLDPLKTTLVHHERAMTTWVVRKNN